jgi:hypothetical protein
MLERLLRIDGHRLEDYSLAERLRAMRALGAAFPDLEAAQAALDAIEEGSRCQHGRRFAGVGRRFWTPEEDRLLRERYSGSDTVDLAALLGRSRLAVFQRANGMGLRKSPELLAEHGRRHLLQSGKAYRFPKGHVPWTKGLKGYDSGGRSHETRFKKGHMPATWVPIGTEVRDPKDGYLKRKVSDDRTKASRFNWRLVHHLLWEKHHGPIPRGHAVAFRDGDRANISIKNLELITRGELAARNHHSNLPPELAEVIFLKGWVKRRMRERQEEVSQDGRAASDR